MHVNKMVPRKSSRLTNQSGYTIVELMTVLAITGFLILAVGIGLSVFFSKFNEITKWEALQKESFECLEQIRTGIAAPDNSLYGLANATKVEFIGGGYNPTAARGIIAYHTGSGLHTNDKVTYSYDGRSIRASLVYGGYSTPSPIYIFPKQNQLDYITIEKFTFSQLGHFEDTSVNYTLIGVQLEAKVKVAKDKYRYIKYNTQIVNKPF